MEKISKNLKQDLVSKSFDIMHDLQRTYKETIGLACLDPEVLTGEVLAEAQGTSGFCFHLEVGYKIPIHTAAPCKAILAFLDSKECSPFVDKAQFTRHTASTITTKKGYYEELQSVRINGYSIDVSEEVEGCHCVGVPIFGTTAQPIAALWITGVSGNLPVRSFPKIAKKLKAAAMEITRRLNNDTRRITPEFGLEVIKKSQKIMKENLGTILDMQELSERLHVGYSWFRRFFKEQTGMSPNQYHLDLRISRAKELLSNTSDNVRTISERLGFKSQNHFSALFKKKAGLSPDNFRKLHSEATQ